MKALEHCIADALRDELRVRRFVNKHKLTGYQQIDRDVIIEALESIYKRADIDFEKEKEKEEKAVSERKKAISESSLFNTPRPNPEDFAYTNPKPDLSDFNKRDHRNGSTFWFD